MVSIRNIIVEKKRKRTGWIWLACVTFIVMQYCICVNVYLMGDDFMYGSFGKEQMLSKVFSYYLTGNGRWLVNIIDSRYLLFDRHLYMIINPWIVLLFVYLLYQLISIITESHNSEVFVAGLIAVSCLSVSMTREVFYWITGSVNYLIPAVLLVFSMCAAIELQSENLARSKKMLLAITCITTCMTMEQYAFMTIGWMLLLWGWNAVKKHKIRITQGIVLLLSVTALSTVVFAPANRIRLDSAAAKGNSLIIKIIDLLFYDYTSVVSSSIIFIICGYSTYLLLCKKKYIKALIAGINDLLLLFVFDYGLISVSGSKGVVLAIISIAMSMDTVAPIIYKLYRKYGLEFMAALVIIGTGSQLMLLRTDLWGFRTSFAWMILHLIILLSLISDDPNKRKLVVLSCIACISMNPLMGLMGVGGIIFVHIKDSTVPIIAVIVPALTIAAGLSDEVYGYLENRVVHESNITSAVEGGQYVHIHPYFKEEYGWSSPPFSEFHEPYFRSYYGISDTTVIEYDDK